MEYFISCSLLFVNEPGSDWMRIGMLQMDVAEGNKERNIRHAFDMLEEAARQANVLVMPELWTIGYNFRDFQERVTHVNDGLINRLSSFAEFHHITLAAGTLPVEKNGIVKNMGLIFGPDGRLKAHYSKRHLFYGYLEAELMAPGTHLMCTDINGVRTGMAVCYEFYFPKMWRRMAKSGTTLVLAPASWPKVHLHQWGVLTRARAIENGMCICAVNMVGTYHGVQLGGHSMFIDPVGQVQVEGDLDEHIYYADYDEIKYKDLGRQLAVIRLEKEIRSEGQ